MHLSGRRPLMALIYLLSFVSAIGNPVVLPSLPFIMQDFQLAPLEMGMIISVYALPGVFVIPLYGMLSDRLGRRPLLFAALFLCGAGSLLCWAAPSFFWLLVGRALQGLSITPLEAMSNTLVSDITQGRERLKLVTRVAAVQYFSIALTPVIVTWLLNLGSWRYGFLFAVALGFGSLLLCLPVEIPYRPSKSVGLRLYGRHLRELLSSSRVLSLFSVRLGSSLLIFGAVYPHLPLFVDEGLHLSPENTAMLFSLYAAGMFTGALLTQWCTARLAPRSIGFLGGAQLAVSMLLLLTATDLRQAAPALLLVGTGSGMLNSCCAGHVSLTATPDTRGSIMSAYSTMFRLGQAVAPLLFGLCYQAGSFNGLFGSGLALAVALTVAAVLSFAYADRMEHSGNLPPHE
ncbi:MFS transporter [uncultured Mailhella sp.]|uniref:MFS transporter n=1 Tax=uncultured Mailhella sp. TaxID=1981031 RepID=UPI0025FF7434|nr:MFS transporter [uncultured Mailhella sp.]